MATIFREDLIRCIRYWPTCFGSVSINGYLFASRNMAKQPLSLSTGIVWTFVHDFPPCHTRLDLMPILLPTLTSTLTVEHQATSKISSRDTTESLPIRNAFKGTSSPVPKTPCLVPIGNRRRDAFPRHQPKADGAASIRKQKARTILLVAGDDRVRGETEAVAVADGK